MVIKINQSDLNTTPISDIDLVTKVEAVLYLKGRPITKKDLSEITNSDINSINEYSEFLNTFKRFFLSFKP